MEKQYTSEQVLSVLRKALDNSSQTALARDLGLKAQVISMAMRGYMTPQLAAALGFEPVRNMYVRKRAK